MDGVHDMGGMHGFGTVTPEKDEPVFHHEWEGRILALNRAMRFMRAWNGDTSRYAKEVLPPHVYLGSSYYKRWALGLEWLVVKYGLVGADELKARRSLRPGAAKPKLEPGAAGKQVLARGSYERPALAPALFAEGGLVRAKLMHTLPHFMRDQPIAGASRGHCTTSISRLFALSLTLPRRVGAGQSKSFHSTREPSKGSLWPRTFMTT